MTTDNNITKLVAEGHRLENAYLYNPLFATETSLIDILPHQLIAVYDTLVKKKRLRFLLADDAGAGKTIMAGLYIREMLSRKAVRKVLIIPPAGLVGNWQNELDNLFRLKFNILKSSELKESSDNPFDKPENSLAIISVDTICKEKFRNLYIEAHPYDLVIFDEAHKLSARKDNDKTEVKSHRYIIAELIAKQNRNLLLMTATPHMGKEDSYYYLWKLLEPTLFSSYKAFCGLTQEDKQNYTLRRMKEDMVFFNGESIFPKRESKTISYSLTEEEASLYEAVTNYCKEQYDSAGINNLSASKFAMMILQRRLASSTLAILKSLERRKEKLSSIIRQLQDGRLTKEKLQQEQSILPSTDYREEKTGEEEDIIDGMEESEHKDLQILSAVNFTTMEALKKELQEVEFLVQKARELYELKHESKFEKLWEALEEYKDTKVLIFTEHRDTLEFIVSRLESKGYSGKIAYIHGGVDYIDRKKMVDKFRSNECTYMIATDAAGEGLNMQFCWVLVNYDIPWNPARIEQRMGRVHRYKQKHNVLLLNLVAEETREGKVLKVLLDKLDRIREELGDKVFDIIGEQLKNISLSELIQNSITDPNSKNLLVKEIETKFNKEVFQKTIDSHNQNIECSNVRKLLEGWRQRQESNEVLKLMPSFVKSYFQGITNVLGIEIEGNIDKVFSLKNLPENISKKLFLYDIHLRGCFTFDKNRAISKDSIEPSSIYLHPGEEIYDSISGLFLEKYSNITEHNDIFIDPFTQKSYIFYLAKVAVLKKITSYSSNQTEIVDQLLIGLKKFENGSIEEAPINLLLDLLVPLNIEMEIPENWINLANDISSIKDYVAFHKGFPRKREFEKELSDKLPELEKQIQESLNLSSAELLEQRARLKKEVEKDTPAAKSKLEKCTSEINAIESKKLNFKQSLYEELNSFEISPVTIYTKAYIIPVPQNSNLDFMKRDTNIEKIAMDFVLDYERKRGAICEDVSNPTLRKGFDILSIHANGNRFIEVKGRAEKGSICLTANEWRQAANHGDKYFLYVVFNCATHPQVYIIQNPFAKLVSKITGVAINSSEIIDNAL